MADFFLYAVTILSGLITVITGSITIIGYFRRKPVPSSKPNNQPASAISQPPPHVPTPQPISSVQQTPKQRSHLSHPRIALIALIAQVLLVAAVTGFSLNTDHYNLMNTLSFLAFLGGEACAITALVMGLIKTIQLHRWGWFIGLIAGFISLFIVFLPALLPLLFGIFGPNTVKQRAGNTQAVVS